MADPRKAVIDPDGGNLRDQYLRWRDGLPKRKPELDPIVVNPGRATTQAVFGSEEHFFAAAEHAKWRLATEAEVAQYRHEFMGGPAPKAQR